MSRKHRKAYMPLFVGDFLADTMHLSATETGIYIRLIMHAWQHEGTIPLDVAKLSNITGCERRFWWRFGKPIVEQFFSAVDGSTAQQKRVATELRRYEEISNKRKAAALQMHMQTGCKTDANAPHPDPDKEDPSLQSGSSSSLRSDGSEDPSSLRSAARTPKRSRARIPFPTDWRPSDWSDFEFERFKDHAIANGRLCAGQVGWEAAWRNWKTSPYRRQNGTGHRSAAADRAYELADEWRRREAEISGTPDDAGSPRPGRQAD